MKDVSKLARRAGVYFGEGINHEGQTFTGSLTIATLLGGRGISFAFKATGKDGDVFHEEFTTIAPTFCGEIVLFNLNTNLPGLVAHTLKRTETVSENVETLEFLHGDLLDAQTFREKITVELHSNGSIGYKYAWGMPGGPFADRSAVVMAQN